MSREASGSCIVCHLDTKHVFIPPQHHPLPLPSPLLTICRSYEHREGQDSGDEAAAGDPTARVAISNPFSYPFLFYPKPSPFLFYPKPSPFYFIEPSSSMTRAASASQELRFLPSSAGDDVLFATPRCAHRFLPPH